MPVSLAQQVFAPWQFQFDPVIARCPKTHAQPTGVAMLEQELRSLCRVECAVWRGHQTALKAAPRRCNLLISPSSGASTFYIYSAAILPRCIHGGTQMELPKIDLSGLPDLSGASGLFGTLSDLATAGTDDRVLVIMVFIYETLPPEQLGF